MENEELKFAEIEKYCKRIDELDMKCRAYENVIKMFLEKIAKIKMK